MSFSPNAGDQYVVAGTNVGTTVVSNGPAVLRRVFFGGTYVGSLNIYDANVATGTSASTLLLSLGLPGLNAPSSMELNIQCKNGIEVEATGTPSVALTWS